MKTHSASGVLFYNTGPSSNKDFVALEIWKGLPRLLLDQVQGAMLIWRRHWEGRGLTKKQTELLPERDRDMGERVQDYQNSLMTSFTYRPQRNC